MTATSLPTDAAAPLIDGAAHIWSADPAAYPWSPLDGVEPPSAGAEDGALLSTLGAAGFAAAVCVQPRVYGSDHTYLLAALDRHPDRIAGVCLLDPDSAQPAASLEEHVLGGACAGARLVAIDRGDSSWLDGPAGDPVWDAAATLAVPVSVLVAPHQLTAVLARARRSPAVTVVIDHLGLIMPAQADRYLGDLLACAAAANVVVKVSALNELSAETWPHLDLEPVVRAVVAEFGPDRIVFGTDWPHALDHGPWGDQLRALGEWGFAAEGHAGLFGANAARLWKLGSAGSAR